MQTVGTACRALIGRLLAKRWRGRHRHRLQEQLLRLEGVDPALRRDVADALVHSSAEGTGVACAPQQALHAQQHNGSAHEDEPCVENAGQLRQAQPVLQRRARRRVGTGARRCKVGSKHDVRVPAGAHLADGVVDGLDDGRWHGGGEGEAHVAVAELVCSGQGKAQEGRATGVEEGTGWQKQ